MQRILPVFLFLQFAASFAVPLVRTERPRIFLRNTAWDGPSVEKIAGWMDRSDYASRVSSLRTDNIGEALYYVITKDSTAGGNPLQISKVCKLQVLLLHTRALVLNVLAQCMTG